MVVTGIGAVTPLGLNWTTSWDRLVLGECGIVNLQQALECQYSNISKKDESFYKHEFELSQQLPCQVAAPVQDLPTVEETVHTMYPNEKIIPTNRSVHMALHASIEAVNSANLVDMRNSDGLSNPRVGVSLATGMSR